MRFAIDTLKRFWSFDTRSLEIALGSLILIRGIVLLLFPELMINPTFENLLETLPIAAWILIFLTAAFFQIGGVIINGHWSKSPWLRFTGAMIGGVVFAMISTIYFTTGGAALLAAVTFTPIALINIGVAINIASKTEPTESTRK